MVEVVEERDVARGWEFLVRVGAAEHLVRMSWVDYEHWSRGGATPASVVAAVVGLMIDRGGPGSVPDRFDAARVRRLHADADEVLRERL
mgnify:CR=1 FL=1